MGLAMQVRNATREDADAIRSVARSSMQASYSLSPQNIRAAVKNWYSEEPLVERLRDDDLLLMVLETDEGVVGFSESTIVDDVGDVLWLHVDPMFRGEGVGEELFAATQRELTDRGATDLRGRVLEDNTEGNEFYEHHGLQKIGEDTVEIGDEEYLENIYAEREPEGVRKIDGPEGSPLYADRTDSDRGSKGAFLSTYSDEDRQQKYGYFCSNCETLVTTMDSMGRMQCPECGNVRKPTRWDAAHL